MAISSSKDLTRLLLAWSNSDESALDKLTPLVYDELRRLARRYLRRERPCHSLQATALVHEAFLRLVVGVWGYVGEHVRQKLEAAGIE